MKENTTCSHCGAAILSEEESRSFDGQILCEEAVSLWQTYPLIIPKNFETPRMILKTIGISGLCFFEETEKVCFDLRKIRDFTWEGGGCYTENDDNEA